jgi:hypothetical protein
LRGFSCQKLDAFALRHCLIYIVATLLFALPPSAPLHAAGNGSFKAQLGILSLPLFAPVIMHSSGALIRRGSVSRSAFHPAGREEERKERGAQGMAEGHLFPPASLFNFF